MPEQTYMWLAGTTRYPCGCTGEGGKDGPTLTPCPLHARAAEMREFIKNEIADGFHEHFCVVANYAEKAEWYKAKTPCPPCDCIVTKARALLEATHA